MTLLQTNATVAVQRRDPFDPTAVPSPVSGLSSVPVFVAEGGSTPAPDDATASYTLKVLWDARYDIREGDTLAGYNPASLDAAQPALIQVQHIMTSGAGTPLVCRAALALAPCFLPEACSVLRAGETVLQTTCRVAPKGQYEPAAGVPLSSVPLYELALPAGTDVRGGDVVTVASQSAAYGVVQVRTPQSYETLRLVQCYLAGSLDDEGAVVPTSSALGLPERCTIRRGTQDVAVNVPLRVAPTELELYPFGAIPNQPVTRWALYVPAGQDIQSNDQLILDDGQRIYVVIEAQAPQSIEVLRMAHAVLSAQNGALGDAYLRPNTTITTIRDASTVQVGRRVHYVAPQANPAALMEKISQGAPTLHVVVLDLADADYEQGDHAEITALDGAALPSPAIFNIAAVVRRPLPFCVVELDLVADVLAR